MWKAAIVWMLLLGACSSTLENEATECRSGTIRNPVSGQCVMNLDAGEELDLGSDMRTSFDASPTSDASPTPDATTDSDLAEPDLMAAPDVGPDLPPPGSCGVVVAGCDDGHACTTDTCVADVCEHVGNSCGWPAQSQSDAENLTAIDRSGFSSDLSGIVYNPAHPRLWLVRNNGPSRVWSLVRDAQGAWRIDTQGATPATWNDFGDAEAIAMADWENQFQVLVLSEYSEIGEYDFSDFSQKTPLSVWRIPELGNSGAEGMTFVPDTALSAGGFVDGNGNPYVSTQGMGGLVFVAHQSRGQIYVLDLNRQDQTYVLVGEYDTARDESSGLEWDGSTGQLMVWHDSDHDELEITRLSSSPGSPRRRFDTMVIYDGPSTGLFISRNFEGIAVEPVTECVNGRRNFYMTTDGGGGYSLFAYDDFSC